MGNEIKPREVKGEKFCSSNCTADMDEEMCEGLCAPYYRAALAESEAGRERLQEMYDRLKHHARAALGIKKEKITTLRAALAESEETARELAKIIADKGTEEQKQIMREQQLETENATLRTERDEARGEVERLEDDVLLWENRHHLAADKADTTTRRAEQAEKERDELKSEIAILNAQWDRCAEIGACANAVLRGKTK
jgi:chromosome segregation ATPase